MELNPEVKQLLDGITANFTQMKSAYDQLKSEQSILGKSSDETKHKVDELIGTDTKLHKDLEAVLADVKDLAQKVSGNAFGDQSRMVKTPGELFAESAQFKNMLGARTHKSGLVEIPGGLFGRKDITGNTADGMTAGYPNALRLAPFTDPKMDLRVRDLLPVTPISATSVEFIKWTFTSNASTIYDASPSPTGRREGILKPLSDMVMTQASATAETIAHLVYVSKQILQDIPQLRSIINTELMYGLKLEEENQILNGDGTAGNLDGLITQATTYDTGLDVAEDTPIDTLRHAILQARLAKYPVDGIVLNPTDIHNIELTKDGNERYIVGDPYGMLPMRIWGKRIVESDSIDAGDFLVGAFQLGARLYDLEQANIESTDSHEDFFRRNMIAIRAEERLILVVTRPAAFVHGSF